jgi:hypothetical protein
MLAAPAVVFLCVTNFSDFEFHTTTSEAELDKESGVRQASSHNNNAALCAYALSVLFFKATAAGGKNITL